MTHYHPDDFKHLELEQQKEEVKPAVEVSNFTPKIELYNMDCMKYMKSCKDNEFDWAIVDPNYGIKASRPSKKSGYVKQKNGSKLYVNDGGYEHKDWDDKPADSEYFIELKRISKHQIIWGVNYYDHVFGKGRIVWDKVNDHMDQNDCEIAYNSFNDRQDIVRYMWAGFMQGAIVGGTSQESLIQIGDKSKNEKRIHPTQKPVKLYKWLLDKFIKKGGRGIDTHGGSMSIAIACYDLGYDIVICEKDKDIFKSAEDRFNNHAKQLRMF